MNEHTDYICKNVREKKIRDLSINVYKTISCTNCNTCIPTPAIKVAYCGDNLVCLTNEVYKHQEDSKVFTSAKHLYQLLYQLHETNN